MENVHVAILGDITDCGILDMAYTEYSTEDNIWMKCQPDPMGIALQSGQFKFMYYFVLLGLQRASWVGEGGHAQLY